MKETIRENLEKNPAGAALLKQLDELGHEVGSVPLPLTPKHPCRHVIEGVLDRVPGLKTMVDETDLHPGLKDFLKSELDKIVVNGAQVDLHLVDHAEGGGSLQVHWKPIQMGRPAKLKPAETILPPPS